MDTVVITFSRSITGMRISPKLSSVIIQEPCLLFGAGSGTADIVKQLQKQGLLVEGIVDNDPAKKGMLIGGLSVQEPRKESLCGKNILVASDLNYQAIKSQLQDFGLKEGVQFRSVFYEPFPVELCGEWEDIDAADFDSLRSTKWIRREEHLRRVWDLFHRYISEFLYGPPSRFLDLGCGTGASLTVLRYLGHRAVGLDYTPGAEPGDWQFRPVVERAGNEVVVHDGSKRPYPFEDDSFDFVTSVWSVRKLADPEKLGDALSEMARIASRGILVLPNTGVPFQSGGKEALDSWSHPNFERVEVQHSSNVYKYLARK